MSALRNCNPDLRKYLLHHRLPDIFESLLTALAVNQPEDGRKYIIEKINELQNDPSLLEQIQWDTFIDEAKKPKNRFCSMDFLWSHENENMRPTLEMLERAHSFYNYNVLKLCYSALRTYWQQKSENKKILNVKLASAGRYYRLRVCKKHFRSWLTWVRTEKDKQRKFIATLETIFDYSSARLVFQAWLKVATDAKKTREYFERIERGEIEDPNYDGSVKKDHISLLPKQTAVNIFLFVDLPDLVNCSKVCRSWKEITQVTVLWSRIDLANAKKELISSKAITSLIQKCRPFLCHLNIRGCNFLHPIALKSIGDCRNLQDLNISNCPNVSDEIIKEITVGCPSLLYVNMSRTEISDASLRHLSRDCNSLQYLNIAHCANISNRGLHYLASGKGSQKLIYLDMSGCDQITRDGFKMLSKGCVRLNSIYLNEMPSLNDDAVEALMTECKNLRMLSMLHSPLLTDVGMRYVCSSKKLHVLKVEGNNWLTDASVKALTRNNHELRFLYLVDVPRVTDMSLKALGQCRNLLVLNVADCIRLSDTGVRYIVEGCSGAKLREINLTNCIRVSDVSLLRISQKCTSLLYANFSYCEHVTDAGVELLATIPTLISIDLSGCNITDAGAIALGNNTKLIDICLSECCQITDVGIQKLVPLVKNLENFDMSHVSLLTDQSLKSLAFCCRRLRVLNISGCTSISDKGLQYVSGVCQFLEKLDLSGCKLISDRSLRYLRKGCQKLKLLKLFYCRGITKSGAAKLQNAIKGTVFHSQDVTSAYLGNRFQ
ncbi:dynein regulatory complex subunit 6-like isoform X1 [Hydractinia symbiolongicarpus]|uniref:dynein regulatory complex subunit 6-like isoform X1 n=1 Tax=Hydractinia symbiolongicarpus TaxID=13093 RepID=UPI00254DFE3B|nr:dynein regulatory complex subunit 6-like isoform X1 [Hydractinia symbiolongicarpus]